MLIVLDGLDGSGKTTQFEIVREILSKEGPVKAVSFPDYDSPSAAPVKMYLRGEIASDASDVNAYAASGFYASDRYVSFKKYWEKNYLDGELILASRYVSSNAVHQMPKLPESEWDDYLEWLYDYEYGKLKLPVPDLTILLDMPFEISRRLLNERYGGNGGEMDIHESNAVYMRRCREAALYAADKLKWRVIPCFDGDKPMSVEAITGKITEAIRGLIN